MVKEIPSFFIISVTNLFNVRIININQINITMELTLTKSKTYNLEPFGKFVIKFITKQGYLPNIIPLNELTILLETTMPMSKEQEKEVVKLMKKYKTDILIDNNKFYTRTTYGLTQINHEKFNKYIYDSEFKELVNNGYSFEKK